MLADVVWRRRTRAGGRRVQLGPPLEFVGKPVVVQRQSSWRPHRVRRGRCGGETMEVPSQRIQRGMKKESDVFASFWAHVPINYCSSLILGGSCTVPFDLGILEL